MAILTLHDFSPKELKHLPAAMDKAVKLMALGLLDEAKPEAPAKLDPPQAATQPAQTESETALEVANLLKQEHVNG